MLIDQNRRESVEFVCFLREIAEKNLRGKQKAAKFFHFLVNQNVNEIRNRNKWNKNVQRVE